LAVYTQMLSLFCNFLTIKINLFPVHLPALNSVLCRLWGSKLWFSLVLYYILCLHFVTVIWVFSWAIHSCCWMLKMSPCILEAFLSDIKSLFWGYLAVYGIDARALHMLGNYSTTEPHSQPLVFWVRFSLCSPGWPWTCDPSVCASQVLGWKAYTTTHIHFEG
jgi:hypothetical protein